MAGIDFDRLPAPELRKSFLGHVASTQVWDAPEHAIRGILAFADTQSGAISTANFASWTSILETLLTVALPAIPADLDTKTEAELRTLAQAAELAFWDYSKRINALGFTAQYWNTVVAKGGTRPTITQYRDFFLEAANRVRSKRGLANLVAPA